MSAPEVEELHAEIRERMGVLPVFFEKASPPDLARSLWEQAKLAYLDNPMPALLKERLFTYLSRFCKVPYCMARHAAFLQRRGRVAGDPTAPATSPDALLRLLETPLLAEADLDKKLSLLRRGSGGHWEWPEPDTDAERALIACAASIYLGGGAEQLRRALGPEPFSQVLMLVAFVRTAHFWSESNPELGFEPDLDKMLREQPELAEWVRTYRDVVAAERGGSGDSVSVERLRAAEEGSAHLGRILEDSLNEIYVFDDQSLRFTRVNRGARENLGYSMEQLRTLTPVDLKPEFTWERFQSAVEPLRRGERPGLAFETVHRRKDGTDYPIEVHLQHSRSTREFVAIVVDLSRSRAQAVALAQSERRLQAIFQQRRAMAVLCRADGSCIEANAAALEFVGLTRERVLDQRLWEWDFSWLHTPEVKSRIRAGFERAVAGEHVRFDLEHSHGARGDVVVDVSLTPILSSKGRPELVLLEASDATESRNLQQQLVQSQKMEVVGALAGGIAHDFNNLLTSILGSSEIILEESEGGSRVARSGERIKKAAERARGLTSQILAFSRRQVTQPVVFPLNEAVREVRELFGRMIPENVDIKLDLDPAVGSVRFDPSQFDQVMINLAVNAGDAMPTGGTLRLSTALTEWDGAAAIGIRPAPGRYARLSVQDSGTGMSPQVQSRIFDPFFTTKEAGRGTGLGLPTVLGILERNGGGIQFESREGAGTIFHAYLPIAAPPSLESSDPPETRVGRAGKRSTILVVEDDDLMRDLMAEVLEAEGHEVLGASDPEAALEIVGNNVEPIDLLVTDVVMPGMSGFALAREISGSGQDIRILYMSGYTDQILADQGELSSADAFLRKPFGNEALMEKVREVLSAPLPGD